MALLAGISILSILEIFYCFLKEFLFESNKVHPPPVTNSYSDTWRNENHALYQLMQYCLEYLKISDIHGLHYVKDQGKFGQIFWLISVMLSVTFCSVLIATTYKQAETSPVAITIDSTLRSLKDVEVFSVS